MLAEDKQGEEEEEEEGRGNKKRGTKDMSQWGMSFQGTEEKRGMSVQDTEEKRGMGDMGVRDSKEVCQVNCCCHLRTFALDKKYF